MSRHLADHRAQSDGGRLKAFLEIERSIRDEDPHPASRELHKRAPNRSGTGRIQHYLRIERGVTT